MGKADIDKEWLKLRPKIAKVKGDKCIYCGAKATEYHHIVPRHMGGDNRLSNIVPLCYECHTKAHSKEVGKQRSYGRKPIETPNSFDLIADMYLGNHITLNDALGDLGLKRHVFYRMLEDYRERTGDERKHKNIGNRMGNGYGQDQFKRQGRKSREGVCEVAL